jgi:hypothetical protein
LHQSQILEILPNRNALLLKSGTGWKPGYPGDATVGLGHGLSGWIYTRQFNEPVIVEHLSTEKHD